MTRHKSDLNVNYPAASSSFYAILCGEDLPHKSFTSGNLNVCVLRAYNPILKSGTGVYSNFEEAYAKVTSLIKDLDDYTDFYIYRVIYIGYDYSHVWQLASFEKYSQ